MPWYKLANEINLGTEEKASIKTKLISAVNSFLEKRKKVNPAYYITNPRRYDFDIKNQDHIKEELGEDYNPSFEVLNQNHPSFLQCRDSAKSLAEYLKSLGFKARVIAGWYGHADRDYRTGSSPGLSDAWPPNEMTGEGINAFEHWWVEAEGFYIDLTSGQFYPRNPQKQLDMVVVDKEEAIKSKDYFPIQRFPLERSVPLPENVQNMVNQITNLKSFRAGESSNRTDLYNLIEWIKKNAKRYGLSDEQLSNVILTLNTAPYKNSFSFSDVRKLSRIFGEAFDEIPESKKLKMEDEKAKPFKPKFIKPNSMGTVKLQYGKLYLSSSYDIESDNRFTKLKDVIKNAWTLPNKITFSPTKYESVNNYGVMLFSAWCDFQMEGYKGNPFELCLYGRLNESETKAIKEVFNAMKSAGFRLAFF